MSRPDSPRRAAEPTPAAGGEHIRPEWVEAAADEMTGYPIGSGYYSLTVGPNEARYMASDVLAAVVPAIQAQALRDWIAPWPTEPGDGTFLQDVARDGLDRADRIERGELP